MHMSELATLPEQIPSLEGHCLAHPQASVRHYLQQREIAFAGGIARADLPKQCRQLLVVQGVFGSRSFHQVLLLD